MIKDIALRIQTMLCFYFGTTVATLIKGLALYLLSLEVIRIIEVPLRKKSEIP